MVELWVSGTEAELKKVRDMLGKFQSEAPAVLAKAINKAANKTKKAIFQHVTERYAIEEKDLRKATHVRKATPSKPTGQITVRGGRLPLSYFTTDPAEPVGNKPRFYYAATKRADGLKTITGAAGFSKGFLVRFESGHKAMVERSETPREKLPSGRFKTKTGKESSLKYELTEKWGLSFAEMTGQRDVVKAIQEEGYNELYRQIDKQVQNLLKAKKGGAG